MYGYYCIEQDYFRMKEVAEKLNIKGFGQNNLFKFLREKGILEFNNQPKEEYVKIGYFKPIDPVPIHKNFVFSSSSCRVSEKGIEFIKSLIEENR